MYPMLSASILLANTVRRMVDSAYRFDILDKCDGSVVSSLSVNVYLPMYLSIYFVYIWQRSLVIYGVAFSDIV